MMNYKDYTGLWKLNLDILLVYIHVVKPGEPEQLKNVILSSVYSDKSLCPHQGALTDESLVDYLKSNKAIKVDADCEILVETLKEVYSGK